MPTGNETPHAQTPDSASEQGQQPIPYRVSHNYDTNVGETTVASIVSESEAEKSTRTGIPPQNSTGQQKTKSSQTQEQHTNANSSQSDSTLAERSLSVFGQVWQTPILRGIIFFVFGAIVTLIPGIGLQWFVWVLSGFFFMETIFVVFDALRSKPSAPWWLWALAFLSAIAGTLILIFGMKNMSILVAILSIITCIGGLCSVIIGLKSNKKIDASYTRYITDGALMLVFGIIIAVKQFVLQNISQSQLTVVTGLFLLFSGTALLAFAYTEHIAHKLHNTTATKTVK